MKFTLEIELGNDAMQSAEDVAEAIRSKLKGIEASTFNAPEGPYNIRDRNGNTVGKWEVKRDLSAALDAVADQHWADAHEPDSPSTAPEPLRSAAAFIAECDRRKKQGNPPPAPDDPFWKK
jgi:hypothetical protein